MSLNIHVGEDNVVQDDLGKTKIHIHLLAAALARRLRVVAQPDADEDTASPWTTLILAYWESPTRGTIGETL